MEAAIKDGRPLSADDLLKAQGMDPLQWACPGFVER
jgi:hypothetical protein